jgi:tight adherence protein B
MLDALLNPIVLLSGIAAFGFILSLWLITLLVLYLRQLRQQERLELRLGLVEPREARNPRVLRLWREGHTVTTTVPRMSFQGYLVRRIEQIREALGWQIPLTTFVLALLGMACLAFLLFFAATNSAVLAAVAGNGMVAVPVAIARRRMRRQVDLFEAQLADALALATRSLRAGHPLVGAFRLIVEEMDPPISTVFAEINQQQALGVPLEEALRQAAGRSPSSDMRLFAASTVIQLRSGGNLADMMERLAHVIRDRIRLHRRARVLTAQVQLSKYILIGLPPMLFLFLFALRRDYVQLLYVTSAGRLMLLLAGVSLILGIWIMNRIATLRY